MEAWKERSSLLEQEYDLFTADAAFFWARIRTFARWLTAPFSSRGRPSPIPIRGGRALPLDWIEGFIDGKDRIRSLPPLRRRHRAAWLRWYLASDPAEAAALALRAVGDRWFLADDEPSLAALEAARAKGFDAARVRPVPPSACVAMADGTRAACRCVDEALVVRTGTGAQEADRCSGEPEPCGGETQPCCVEARGG